MDSESMRMMTDTAPSVWMQSVNNFLSGTTLALSLVAALVFVRFYVRSRDRLFIFFAGAFAILGINRIFFLVLAALGARDESRTWLYVVRLVAFVLILYAILDKNRRGKRPQGEGLRKEQRP